MLQTMWTNYSSSNPGKLHIVAANTQTHTIAQLNGSTWRTKFTPNLTYFIADKTMLGNTYSLFGNGYVPMNVVIGGGNRVIFSDNDMPSNAVIDQAIMSLDIYIQNPIPTTSLNFNQSTTKDLTNCFTTTNGQTIVYTLDSVEDPNVVTAALNGNSLTLTAGAVAGMSKVKIKATAGTIYGYHEFLVKSVDPNQVNLLAADFDVFPPADWTNASWAKGSGGVIGSCAKAAYQPAGTKTLTSPAVTLPAVEATTLSFYWKNNDISKIVGQDSTFCEISKDNGTTWTKLATLSASSPQSAFTKVTKVLDTYKNETVKIRWRYWTNGSNSAYGVGVDEILLSYTTSAISNGTTPAEFSLLQNYPNPFNPTTTISFNLENEAIVKLTVYNQAGEEVAVLSEGKMAQGINSVNFDGSGLNSGVYFYTLQAGSNRQTGKMLLIK